MATRCPVGFDTHKLREEISTIYERVASDPEGDFHFHRGPEYAAERLGYDLEQLRQLPATATASFAGVGNPHSIAALARGETVVDVGCGAGMDLLLAARAVGPTGRAIGVDMTAAMRERAQTAARQAGLAEIVDVRGGDAESLPVDDGIADVVISNGVLNLTTDKHKAFGEIARVLAPGGRLQLADIVVGVALSEGARNDIDLWTG
ncbi:MAG: methyltransferase domain-containing protein [Myxococcales bacterium]|nr:methyltransferase domain-containing protein [Myxococcales bacterium]